MERAALEDLYRKYGSLVFRRARMLLRNEEEANDMMQEVFVRVIRNFDGFREEASPVTWLYKITTNLCLNRIRDRKRQREKVQQNFRPDEAVEAPGTERQLAVLRLLDQLPPDLVESAVYYHVDGMSQAEIATAMALPRRTVGHRLEQFRRRARAILGADAIGEHP